jgi:hypothetical protein
MNIPAFHLSAVLATDGRPIGERHLLTRMERGPHGLTVATAAVVILEARGVVGFREANSFPFESEQTAREWLAAWVWYRIANRKKVCP